MQTLLLIEGQKHGPYELAEVIKFCELGQLDKDDLCWTERLDGWTPLSKVPEFALVFALKPPEIPPLTNSGNRTPVESNQQKNYKQSKLSWASLLTGLVLGGLSGWQIREEYAPQAVTAIQNPTAPIQKSFSEAKPTEANVVLDEPDKNQPEESKIVEPAPIPPDEIIVAGAKILNELLDTSNYRRGSVLVSNGVKGLVRGTLIYPIRLKQGDVPMTVYYAKDTFDEWVVFVEGLSPIPCNPNR